MPRKSYFKDILSVFGSNVSVTASNLLGAIILTRILGAAGYGIYSAIIVVPVMVMGFTQLGIRRAAIFHIGQKQYSNDEVISAIFILWIITSVLSILICGLVYMFSESNTAEPAIIVLVLCAIPFLLVNVFGGGIFLGKEEILRANIMNAGPALINLILIVLFVWILKLSVVGAIASIALANFIMFFFIYRIVLLEYRAHITWKYHEHIMKSMVQLGIVNALAIFIMQLNYRVDILLLKKLSTLEQVGFYSLATHIAEQLLHIPYAIETIILSRSANTADNLSVNRAVSSIFRVSFLIGFALCLVIYLLAPVFIPLIFGKEFNASIPMIRFILPGILILLGFRILNSRLTGMGKPQVAIWAFLPALVINIILNLIWIPRFGAMGAVWATNASYGAGAIAFILIYSRKLHIPIGELIRFRKSDFYFFKDLKSIIKWKKTG